MRTKFVGEAESAKGAFTWFVLKRGADTGGAGCVSAGEDVEGGGFEGGRRGGEGEFCGEDGEGVCMADGARAEGCCGGGEIEGYLGTGDEACCDCGGTFCCGRV